MTGFGRGSGRVGATEASIEVRSVNGRFGDVSIRGPRSLGAFDSIIQARCKDVLERGNVSVTISVQRPASASAYRIDKDRAGVLIRMLEELRDTAGLSAEQSPIVLDHLLRFPDVLSAAERDPDEEESEGWAAVQPALDAALESLDAMRIQEGEALRADLLHRLSLIGEHLGVIEARAPVRVVEAHERLRERLGELLADERLNNDRLETELAVFADKLDVTEECVRLRSHLAQFHEALHAEESVGRRLNFLAQECNREINTIASKANDSEIAQRAVRMKEELEKVREQVQNVV